MRIKASEHPYVTKNGKYVYITHVAGGVAQGYFFDKDKHKETALWSKNGRRFGITRKSPLDIVAAVTPPKAPNYVIADAQFKAQPAQQTPTGSFIATFTRGAAGGGTFKTRPFPSVKAVQEWAAHIGIQDRIIDVVEVQELRTVWSAS